MRRLIISILVIVVCALAVVVSRKAEVPAAAEDAGRPSVSELSISERTAALQDEPLVSPTQAEERLPVNHPVYTVVDPKAGYRTRLEAMRKLGKEMSADEITVLMDFLNTPMPADAGLKPLSYNSIRNDAYEILLRQDELPDGMGELLVEGYNSPDEGDMWRNYCIQFMQPLYERVSAEHPAQGAGGENDGLVSSADADSGVAVSLTEELKTVRDTLWKALEERDNSNAGTALLALDKLSRNHDEFSKDEIQAAVVDLALDNQASTANRITAVRLCGEQGNAEALETVRDLARNSGNTMLRCAAIATLGDIGTEEDLELL